MSFGNEVAKVLDSMRTVKRVCKDELSEEAIQAGNELVRSTKGLWRDVLEKIKKMIYAELPLEYPNVAIWWYSVLIGMDKDEALFLEFVSYVRESRMAFCVNTQYYLFYQLSTLLFRFKELDGESKEVLWKYYREIVTEYAEHVSPALLEEISIQDRNKDVVVVITEQFIAIQHGPTKTALDRCKALVAPMGKEVLLINDAEVLSQVDSIPFYNTVEGNYLPEKKEETVQHWEGVTIPYYQCENNMPNISEVENLLRKIRALAPERIIAIGKGGILANLAGRMVPMLTIGLCPSDLEYTTGTYQTLGRKLNESDFALLDKMGYTRDHVIESIFTSSLKPQVEHVSRAELGIPDDKFVMTVIGGRLSVEVTDEFLSMLENSLNEDMYVVFWGRLSEYHSRISAFPKLKKQSAFLGFCNDVLSRLEVCDLYVNPTRKGGGTSCVEAMFKGVPVVSVDYGDVAVNAGDEFCVKDYDEMRETIMRYYSDKEFYDRMSQHAQQRAELLLDTDKEFVRILQEMDRREAERNE